MNKGADMKLFGENLEEIVLWLILLLALAVGSIILFKNLS